MAKTIDELKVQANQIKNETAQGANTSQRIGQMHLDAIEYIENQDKKFNELNISVLYPTQGIGGSNCYTLETAITQVPAEYRVQGVKVSFVNESGDTESWEYTGTIWTVDYFSEVGASKFSQLDKQYIFANDASKRSLIFTKVGYFASIIDASFMLDTYDANKKYGLYFSNLKNKPYRIALYELSPLKSVIGFNCSDDGPVLLFKENDGGESYVKIDLSKLDLEANFSINAKLGIELNPRLFNNPSNKRINEIELSLSQTKAELSQTKNDLKKVEEDLTIKIEEQTAIEEYGSIDNNGRLNAYARSTGATFFTNQYTSRYYYSLYILPSNSKVKVELKKALEKDTVFVGLINSEDDFIIGGKITDFIITGDDTLETKKYILTDNDTTKYLVVLGTKTNEYEYCSIEKLVSKTSTKEKLNVVQSDLENIKKEIGETAAEICCPDTFYAVVGQEFNLYYDSLIKGMDAGLQSPFGVYVDIQCPDLQNASNQIGVRRERMWQIDGSKLTSDYLGEHNLQITAFDNNGKQLSQKDAKIIVTNSSPLSSKKYILCIGDSLTNNGPIVATLGQHFQDLGGTQPIFVGQRTSSGYKHEGYPGYSFGSFVSSTAGYSYRIFDVPTGTIVSVGDKYSTNGRTYIVRDIRTEGLDNKLRLRCEVSGSEGQEPTPTGTLTKVSGSSSSAESIEYSAYEEESGNPFWDEDSGANNFAKYREKMSMGDNKFDIVIIMLGTNDCIGNIKDMNNSLLNAKKLIETIFEDAGDYPTKVILQMTPPDANTISSWQVYSDSDGTIGRKMGYWTNLWNLRKLLYDEFTKSEWENKVYLGQAALGLDRYYGFPNTKIKSSNRINIEERYHTNSVHPNNEGYQQLGDGYYLQAKGLLES